MTPEREQRSIDAAHRSFDGVTYDPAEDYTRLKTQLQRVRWHMTHPAGKWWRIMDLRTKCGGTEAGISARIRDLRKPKNGGFRVEHKRATGGLWLYRVHHYTPTQLTMKELK